MKFFFVIVTGGAVVKKIKCYFVADFVKLLSASGFDEQHAEAVKTN